MYSELTPKSTQTSWKKKLVKFAFDTGAVRLGRQIWAKSLTVLNYHRIDDPDREGFDTFKPNVSARPEEFERQMEYVSRWHNVVSMNDIANWLDGKKDLPPYAALITFDDGYLDNYTHAYPVLRKYKFPAIIFLTTDHIGSNAPFYWDLTAYCFHHTTRTAITFPDGRESSWNNSVEMEQVCKAWIEAIKMLPNLEKQKLVSRLPDQMNVSIPQDFFRGLMTSWDQIREMRQNGIEFGGHTMTHAILSRVDLDGAVREIEGSKDRIEQELGEKVQGFAYPNGMSSDLNSDIERAVANAGYKAAFTLLNGPSTLREVRSNPFAIRRIFISYLHSLSHFALLTHRINRYRK